MQQLVEIASKIVELTNEYQQKWSQRQVSETRCFAHWLTTGRRSTRTRASCLPPARPLDACLSKNRIFDDGTGKVNIRKALEDFMHFIPDRCRTENPVVHISLNPHPDDRLTDTDMENIAREYMEKIGFGGQPYMVYKHEDIDRHHMHIVTIRVKEDGKAISSSNNFYQSKRATRELEKKYNLHTAERGQAISEIPLRKVNASEGDVKKQIANTVKAVVCGYHYQTLGELRAVLSLYNIAVEETRGIARNREYHGLVYSATDDNGNKNASKREQSELAHSAEREHPRRVNPVKVGNPFKASKIGPSVGYEAVQKRFAWSKKHVADKGIAASLKEKILPILVASSNAEDFKSRLQAQGMDVVFRYTDTGRIYGATFIDHDSHSVLNGSRIGKVFSANALEQHFNTPKEEQIPYKEGTHSEQEQYHDSGTNTSERQQTSADMPNGNTDYHNSASGTTTFLDALDVLNSDNPTVDPEEEAFRRKMQRKKKKIRGPRL